MVPELTPNRDSNPNLSQHANSSPAQEKQSPSQSSSQSSAPPKAKISTKTINMKLNFEAPASELFECFLDQRRISAFTQSESQITPEVGGNFSLFSGQIVGQIVELNRPSKLVKKWRFKDWPEDHYSTVTLSLEQTNQGTQLTLKQTGVPSSDFDRTQSGWHSQFWIRIRGVFGFNFREL